MNSIILYIENRKNIPTYTQDEKIIIRDISEYIPQTLDEFHSMTKYTYNRFDKKPYRCIVCKGYYDNDSRHSAGHFKCCKNKIDVLKSKVHIHRIYAC